MKPGKVYAFDLDLGSTRIVFNRGHQGQCDAFERLEPPYSPPAP